MEATHRHTWVYQCWMTDADQVASCQDADSEMECPETLSHLDMTIRVNAHDRLVEALEALVGEIENSDTEWGISSSLLVGAYLTRDQLAEARAALALARGEVE